MTRDKQIGLTLVLVGWAIILLIIFNIDKIGPLIILLIPLILALFIIAGYFGSPMVGNIIESYSDKPYKNKYLRVFMIGLDIFLVALIIIGILYIGFYVR